MGKAKMLPHQVVWLEAYLNNRRIFEIARDPELNPLGKNVETIREFIQNTGYYKPYRKRGHRLCLVCGRSYPEGTYAIHKGSNIHTSSLREVTRNKLNQPYALFLARKGLSAELISKICNVKKQTVVKLLNFFGMGTNENSDLMLRIKTLPFATKTTSLKKILDELEAEYQKDYLEREVEISN